MDPVAIEHVDAGTLETVLPLLGAYQRFYGVEAPDEERNRAFFARFCDGGEGILLRAVAGDAVVGVACVYWTQDSIAAADIALLHDLYVVSGSRGAGIGRALLEAAAEAARRRGLTSMSWSTAPDNHAAQRLYDSLGAERSSWLEYTLDL